jgi:hypothetical protein
MNTKQPQQNQLSFYKPNSYNKGMACSFRPGQDGGLYVSFIRQHSWNASTKNGSFKGNMNDPKMKRNMKLSIFEAGGISSAILEKGKWSAFHKFGEGGASIMFGPYEKDGVFTGFVLRLTDSKDKENAFSIGFTPAEAAVLNCYLLEFVRSSFYNESIKGEPQDSPSSSAEESSDF